MIDQRINDSLKELEQGLRELDSARKQVEKTVNSYDGLHSSTSDYVSQLGVITTNIRSLISTIQVDYANKVSEYEKDRTAILEATNAAIDKLTETTEIFKHSLRTSKILLVCSVIINILSLIAIGMLVLNRFLFNM